VQDDPGMDVHVLLRAGVTKPCLDPIMRSTWLAAAHESMRIGSGAVTAAVEEPTVGRNYYRLGARLRCGTPVALLLNAAAGVVAAGTPGEPHSVSVLFADVPHGEVFSRAGFRVAAPADLDRPLAEEHLRSLAADERREIAYHRPDRLGDLLFNWFD
jgi:hypothetical protein